MSRGVESRPRKRSRSRRSGAGPVALALPPDVRLYVSSQGFRRLCMANRDLRLERGPKGEVVVMPPAGGESSHRNADITAQLWTWNHTTKLGVVFDSSGGFTLPNTAVRAADAAWIRAERWAVVPEAERQRFSRICPDFVIELRSPSDNLSDLEKKMEEYIAQGVRLGWLLDPRSGTVQIDRPDRPVERLSKPTTLSGEDVLPGFVLELKGILFD